MCSWFYADIISFYLGIYSTCVLHLAEKVEMENLCSIKQVICWLNYITGYILISNATVSDLKLVKE